MTMYDHPMLGGGPVTGAVRGRMGMAWNFIRRGAVAGLLVGLLVYPALSTAYAAPLGRDAAYRRAAELRALGAEIFSDPSLSGSGRMACSSCHVPAAAFGPSGNRAVEWGGKGLDQPGHRAVPNLTYLQAVPDFTEHYFDRDEVGDDSVDNGPSGGLTWDGRVDRAADQARTPLYSPFEMAAESPAAVAAALRAAPYADRLRTLAGGSDAEVLVTTALAALAAYQQTPDLFYPYSSKYDAVLKGRARLTEQEARGLDLFNDPAKGNCASCHKSAVGVDGTPPDFTDYGLIALGLPRNREIPANNDPAFFDLGLCGPDRTDFKDRAEYCGLFRTPSLRNVATRQRFFHNGVITSLKDAVAFYATRDTDPGRWYPRRADGGVEIYDDLPEPYRSNLNQDPPFGGKPGDRPALDEGEIEAIVAFLGTLSDGWGR